MKYSKFIWKYAGLAITLGGMTSIAAPALAKVRPVVVTGKADLVTSRISYLDLNLTSADGEATLSRRVGGAIVGLCTDVTGGNDGSFQTAIASRNCRNSAWGQARPQIANAVRRANELASTGSSTMTAASIAIMLPK